jgi:hypothetical protein
MDAVAIGFPEAPRAWHVCEFKTHSEKSFLSLKRDGVAKAKPQHWAQMQTYMHLAGLERAFYLAVNKNTDELYQERLHYDAEAALRIMAKAERIIAANRPPARITPPVMRARCLSGIAVPACMPRPPMTVPGIARGTTISLAGATKRLVASRTSLSRTSSPASRRMLARIG